MKGGAVLDSIDRFSCGPCPWQRKKALLAAILRARSRAMEQPGTGWNVFEMVNAIGDTISYCCMLDTRRPYCPMGFRLEQILWIAPLECWARPRLHPFSRGENSSCQT